MSVDTVAVKEAPRAVQVRFMGDLPAVVGRRQLRIDMPENGTVSDLMASLSDSYGERFSSRVLAGPETLHHYMLVFVDGENIEDQDGFAT